MPHEFEEEIQGRKQKVRRIKRPTSQNVRERGARRKGQYTTIWGTPIIQGKPS